MYQTEMGTFHPLWHGRGGSQESETETIYYIQLDAIEKI